MAHSHSPFASPIRYAAIALVGLILALWPFTLARADSPFDDPAFRPPQGGAVGSATSHTTPIAELPAGYTEIPPPSSMSGTPARGPFFQRWRIPGDIVIGGREEHATNALKRVPMGIHQHIHEG